MSFRAWERQGLTHHKKKEIDTISRAYYFGLRKQLSKLVACTSTPGTLYGFLHTQCTAAIFGRLWSLYILLAIRSQTSCRFSRISLLLFWPHPTSSTDSSLWQFGQRAWIENLPGALKTRQTEPTRTLTLPLLVSRSSMRRGGARGKRIRHQSAISKQLPEQLQLRLENHCSLRLCVTFDIRRIRGLFHGYVTLERFAVATMPWIGPCNHNALRPWLHNDTFYANSFAYKGRLWFVVIL